VKTHENSYKTKELDALCIYRANTNNTLISITNKTCSNNPMHTRCKLYRRVSERVGIRIPAKSHLSQCVGKGATSNEMAKRQRGAKRPSVLTRFFAKSHHRGSLPIKHGGRSLLVGERHQLPGLLIGQHGTKQAIVELMPRLIAGERAN
jgi:hypothetical protein